MNRTTPFGADLDDKIIDSYDNYIVKRKAPCPRGAALNHRQGVAGCFSSPARGGGTGRFAGTLLTFVPCP